MPSGKGDIMSTTIGVTFEDCKLGPVGKLSLPSPDRSGNVNVYVILNMNHIYFKSLLEGELNLRCYGECEYTDYNGRTVTIKHEDVNVWNQLEITITIED